MQYERATVTRPGATSKDARGARSLLVRSVRSLRGRAVPLGTPRRTSSHGRSDGSANSTRSVLTKDQLANVVRSGNSRFSQDGTLIYFQH